MQASTIAKTSLVEFIDVYTKTLHTRATISPTIVVFISDIFNGDKGLGLNVILPTIPVAIAISVRWLCVACA